MRKAIFILGTMLALLSCEATRTWEVTTTVTEERWNAYQHFFISSKVLSVTKETVVDMTEEEISDYCAGGMTMETFNGILYKVITKKNYVEVK